MKLYRYILSLCILFIYFCCAQTLSAQFEIPKKPKFQTSVYDDYIQLLTPSEKKNLERKLIQYSDTTSTQIVVAIISSTDGENINYLGAQWAHSWGIGQEKEDNGIFILLAKDDRKIVIDHCDHLWREDFSVWTQSFFYLFESEHFHDNDMPGPVVEQIREVEDYFAKCREYYYSECGRNDWDMFQICHSHPFLTTSPRLKFPNDFKTLVMRLDPGTNMVVGALQDIKSNNFDPIGYVDNFGDNIRNSECIQLSDDSVSYRKIFFENDRLEIMKMYEFFDNKAYFHKNRPQIMKEFKEYHDKNMEVIKKFMPLFYEQITDR